MYKWIRCPWCEKHYPKSVLVFTEKRQHRLKCRCGYWTEYLDVGLICASGKDEKSTKIKWFKTASISRKKATKRKSAS